MERSGRIGALCRLPCIAMMQAPDFGNLHAPAHLRPLDRPPGWRVLVEREMRSCAVIVREVRGQDATQVAFAQNDDMIEALPPDRTDEPFHERILPSSAPACGGSFERETWTGLLSWFSVNWSPSHARNEPNVVRSRACSRWAARRARATSSLRSRSSHIWMCRSASRSCGVT